MNELLSNFIRGVGLATIALSAATYHTTDAASSAVGQTESVSATLTMPTGQDAPLASSKTPTAAVNSPPPLPSQSVSLFEAEQRRVVVFHWPNQREKAELAQTKIEKFGHTVWLVDLSAKMQGDICVAQWYGVAKLSAHWADDGGNLTRIRSTQELER